MNRGLVYAGFGIGAVAALAVYLATLGEGSPEALSQPDQSRSASAAPEPSRPSKGELPEGFSSAPEHSASSGRAELQPSESQASWWEVESKLAEYHRVFREDLERQRSNAERTASQSIDPGADPSHLDMLKALQAKLESQATSGLGLSAIGWGELGELPQNSHQTQFVRLWVEKAIRLHGEDGSRRTEAFSQYPLMVAPADALAIRTGHQPNLEEAAARELESIYWSALGQRAAAEPELHRCQSADLSARIALGAGKAVEPLPAESDQLPFQFRAARDRADEAVRDYLRALDGFIARYGLLQ